MSGIISSALFYFRCLLIIIWGALGSIAGIILCLLRWGDLNLDRSIARIIAFGVLPIAKTRVEVENAENLEKSRPCIFVSNHQSNFDIAVLGRVIPGQTVGIGKKELLWVPFFGLAFVGAGNVLIDRSDRYKAVASLSQAAEKAKRRGASIWVFPEGTRNSQGEGMLPFKKGAFYMAVEVQLPIVPVVFSHMKPVVDFKRHRITGGTIKVRVLPPVEVKGMTRGDVDALSGMIRARMLEAFHGLST